MEVIDDFIPKSFQDELEQVLTRHDFPWYYQPNINSAESQEQIHGFTHQFYQQENGVQSSFLWTCTNHVTLCTTGLYVQRIL